MSTRSYICRENEDGTYTGVYCHSDGYLTYNGAMLMDNYNLRERVDRLMELGNMSCLNPMIEPDPSKPHKFDDRQEGVTVFYGRDRGEKDQEAKLMSLEEINDPSSWIEYCYVYGKDNRWRYFECGKLQDGLKDLQEGLEEEYSKLGFPRPKEYYGFFTKDDIAFRKDAYEKEKSQQEMG
jgi:hypothetical protein